MAQRSLPVTPAHWKPDTTLLANMEQATGITTLRLRDVLRRFFLLAAESIQGDHPALADDGWRHLQFLCYRPLLKQSGCTAR